MIRLTKGGQAKVEEKPEVRKAGGVYYTPAYIVDYIVQNTVGKLLEGKTPKEAARLRIVDPACGSGSFLIGAYRFLLDWHRDRYVEGEPDRLATGRNPALYRNGSGLWKLSGSPWVFSPPAASRPPCEAPRGRENSSWICRARYPAARRRAATMSSS